MDEPRRWEVAVLVETSTSWGSGIVKGVARYSREHGPWFIFLEPRGRKEPLRVPPDWSGDGIIARVDTSELADEIRDAGIPTVNVSWFEFGAPNIARVTNDPARMGELAAQHLLERGLQHFGILPPHDRKHYVDRQSEAFIESIASAGGTVERFDVAGTEYETLSWRERRRVLGDWLLRLRKPAGVMAFSDVHGRMLTEAARDRGIQVPGEVAVISCERDDLTALVSVPALSSIESNAEEVGFAAARQLDLILRGGLIPPEIKYVPPKGVVARQSTDILAIEDAQLSRACDFIRDNAYRPIGVEDVVEHVGISRRSLERRLRAALGVSPSELIRRRRIETGTRLLFDTDLSLTEIAIRSGFSSAQAMTRAFRAEYGKSPGEFRRERLTEV